MAETPNIAKLKPKEERKLPSIADLYADESLAPLARSSAFQVLLNQPPAPQWVKKHPIIKKEVVDDHGNKQSVPLEYIPVERIEWLLTNIFIKTRVEVKSVQLIANSVCVSVRLHYFDHIEKEWSWQDGVGAAPLQTDKGAGATDFNAIKSGAVQMSAPAAESYAVKDAAEKIGKLFGKDLNRKDIISYDSLVDKYAKAMSNGDDK